MKVAHCHRRGFTLVELLVVISIIALLISILLPSLSKARSQAKKVVCASNIRNVGLAVAQYTNDNKGAFPASYMYPSNDKGYYKFPGQDGQTDGSGNGYLHWSWFLYKKGEIGDEAFQCPEMANGGHPRTNPGKEVKDWESGQLDDQGQTGSNNNITDKQATRMAYTANAALMPRNKFTSQLSGGARINKFVSDSSLERPGGTILATEFAQNWQAISLTKGGGSFLSKSHRPINPFLTLAGSSDEYKASVNVPSFQYGQSGSTGDPTQGLLKFKDWKNTAQLIDTNSVWEVNAVGRHHPGGDKEYGGTANYLYADNHVGSATVKDTLVKREWGQKYYAITGDNRVVDPNFPPIKK